MNNRARKTFEQIFKHPTPSNILWKDIETLFLALGGRISEGSGSRVRVQINGVRASFHRPHPQPETDKGAVNSVRKFLINSGVEK